MNAKKAKALRRLAREHSPTGEPVRVLVSVPHVITRRDGKKTIRKQMVNAAESMRGRYVNAKKGAK